MARVVWLARHGNRQDFVDPDWPKTAERPHDPGLSPDGIEQARKLGQRLSGEDIDYLFASPFLRTVETAHYVAEELDQPIFLEPGIGEWLNPEWFSAQPEKLTYETLAERFPRIDLAYTPHHTPRYPETKERALERAAETARALADSYDGALLLVGHGASVSGIAGGLAADAGAFDCALCSLFKLTRRDAKSPWTMRLCADVSHLDESLAADRLN